MKNTITNKKLQLGLGILGLTGTLFLGGCKDVTKPDNTDPQENFSTVILNFTNTADAADKMSDTVKFAVSFSAGPTLSKNQTIALKSGATYTVTTELWDETRSPKVDMALDVGGDSDIHQLFYTVSGANLTVTYDDKDVNNHPVGLETTFKAGAAGTGTLTITLKHQQEGTTKLKPAIDWTAHPQGDITVGETDVEAPFNVTIL
ncbi:MAG: hypothetical protein JWO30_1386 [Fibrobacteres bacterium]|nr:hypothetical protein [Fibrobacterota bacterium]